MKQRTSIKTSQDLEGVVGRIARIRGAANLLIERELHRRGMIGIVPAHGSVLHFLFSQENPVPITSLVQRSGRVKSTVTGIVNTLERYGYLSKQPCDQDARCVRVCLTDKGWALKKDFEEISVLLLAKLYGGMPEQDRNLLVGLLSTVEDNLES